MSGNNSDGAPAPDVTKVEIESDGTVITTHPDGTVTFKGTDGSSSTATRSRDGSTKIATTNPDGTTRTRETSSDGTVVTTKEDGTTETETPDGTVVTKSPDGSETTYNPGDKTASRHNADGSWEVDQPDGTHITMSPDGKVTVVPPQGASGQLPTGQPPTGQPPTPADPGHIPAPATSGEGTDAPATGTLPDGSQVITQPDGSVTTRSPAGDFTTRHQDGSIDSLSHDGTSTSVAADGTVKETRPDGTVLLVLPDGTMIKTIDDAGTTVTTNPDGTHYVSPPINAPVSAPARPPASPPPAGSTGVPWAPPHDGPAPAALPPDVRRAEAEAASASALRVHLVSKFTTPKGPYLTDVVFPVRALHPMPSQRDQLRLGTPIPDAPDQPPPKGTSGGWGVVRMGGFVGLRFVGDQDVRLGLEALMGTLVTPGGEVPGPLIPFSAIETGLVLRAWTQSDQGHPLQIEAEWDDQHSWNVKLSIAAVSGAPSQAVTPTAGQPVRHPRALDPSLPYSLYKNPGHSAPANPTYEGDRTYRRWADQSSDYAALDAAARTAWQDYLQATDNLIHADNGQDADTDPLLHEAEARCLAAQKAANVAIARRNAWRPSMV